MTPEVREGGNAVVGNHGGVFDAVLRVGARRSQCRDGDDELRGGHAVHRDGSVLGVALGDELGQPVEVEIGVVQDPLARRKAVHTLAQLAVPVRLDQLHDVADVEIRCGVGDAGDAVSAQHGG